MPKPTIEVAVDGRDSFDDLASDYVVWLDGATTLQPGALDTIVDVLDRFTPDLVYADSREGGVEVTRPDPSPVRLRSQDYLGGLRVIRREHVMSADRADLRAVTRRLASESPRVVHIPQVLSTRTTLDAPVGAAGFEVADEPLVSIIMPTRGGSATIWGTERVLVVEAVRGIVELSTYQRTEIVVVADDETPQAVIDELIRIAGDRLRLVRWSAPFNFSAKLNRGAAFARGDYFLVLNDDIQIISPDWIEVMLSLVQQDDVGLVGTMLLFEDGTIQHGGHLYKDSSAGHIALGWADGEDDALHSLTVDREVSGVTAACAMLSATEYLRIGGFSDAFPGNYNDVDFCLKIRAGGRSIVWTPRARLYHFESRTRDARVAASELATLRRRWEFQLLVDSYWPEPPTN